MCSWRNHNNTWRTLPTWAKRANTPAIASRMRRSGSNSMRSSSLRTNPMATVVCRSPRAALSLSASTERWRSSDSSISDIVPFMPNSNLSLTLRGSYTPSSSMMTLPTRAPELQQRMPVAAVARQAGRFYRHHGADLTIADGCQQSLEAWTHHTTGGDTEVIVDDDHNGPPEQPSAIGQRVLASTTLMVVAKLIGSGLPHVDVGTACQVFSGDLRHCDSPWS